MIWRLVAVAVITIISGLVGEFYGDIVYPGNGQDYYQGFRTGASIGLISALVEIFYIRSVRRSWIRRVAFLPGLLVRILVLTLIVRLCLVGNEVLTNFLTDGAIEIELKFEEQARDTLISMGLVIVFVTLSQLSSVIGFRRFINLVVGRYFRPVSEERLFLFIDLVGSSRLARELGNVRFHEFLSEFFYHADRALVRHGGEIVSYVGDAVIATWPITADKKQNARCLLALSDLEQIVERQAAFFQSEFGVTPRFRAALHGGPVVVGECGDSRRQVTFLGDVINMTARIEDVARETGADNLASAALMELLDVPPFVKVAPHGAYELRGSDKKFALVRVRFA